MSNEHNEYRNGDSIKALQIDTLFYKLPLDFNGTLGDALIDLGNYANQIFGDDHELYAGRGKHDGVFEKNWKTMSYNDYREHEWTNFLTLYTDSDKQHNRCNLRGGIVESRDGKMTYVQNKTIVPN